MHTVYEVSKLANVTIKTLYYYHRIGLLIPDKITEDGVRFYSKKNLAKLQEILFYKELDFSLKEIKIFLNGTMSRKDILIEQKILLKKRIEMFKMHIQTIDKELNENKDCFSKSKKVNNMFDNFSKKEWKHVLERKQKYIKEKYNVDINIEKFTELDDKDFKKFIIERNLYLKDMTKYLLEKKSPYNREVINRTEKHYQILKKITGKSSMENLKEKTEVIIMDDYYRNAIEEHQIGLSYYLNKVATYIIKENKE